jgi:hypothetical protein
MSAKKEEVCLVKGCRKKAILPRGKADPIELALCLKHHMAYSAALQKMEHTMRINRPTYNIARLLNVPENERDTLYADWKLGLEVFKEHEKWENQMCFRKGTR